MSKKAKRLLLCLIFLTTAPFFLMLLSVDYSYFSVDLDFFYFDLAKTLGSIFGFIGAVFMMWEFLLGTRFIARKISPDVMGLNGFHKNIGIYGMLFVFIHPFIQMYVYAEDLAFVLIPGSLNTNFDQHVAFGRMAFYSVLLIWVTSAILRKKIAFRPWKYIHYIAYAALGLVFIHALDFGSTVKNNDVMRVVWIVLFIAYILFVLFRLWQMSGFGKKKYSVVSHKKFDGEIHVFRLKAKGKHIVPKVGQYCYIQMKRFGESHPFSVVEYDEKSHELVFGIRESGRYTRKMKQIVEGDTLFLDGAYGVFTREGHNAESKVLISGGIGITPFVDVVKKYGNEKTYLINCNRNLGEVIYRDDFKKILGDNYIDVLSDQKVDEKNVLCEMLSTDVLKRVIPEDVLLNSPIFFCGSPGFYAATRKMLIELGVSPEKIFYEEFSI